MPELPEVEVTRLSLMTVSAGRSIDRCRVNERRLRYPVSQRFAACMEGNRIIDWRRRGKYLIADLKHGHILVHLGMSGRLTHSRQYHKAAHDHIVWHLDDGLALVYNDPRRFGCVLYADNDHFAPLASIGPEPLLKGVGGAHLQASCGVSRRTIKDCLMDQRTIAGLGNIYVCEALFCSGIHPQRAGMDISRAEYIKLARVIKSVLRQALKAGGTSLRDFAYGADWPGYFALSLRVYDRAGLPCLNCGTAIKRLIIAGRSTCYCPKCQPPDAPVGASGPARAQRNTRHH
ncbi:MAG: bifunctional DNA-formamidopyrimidine glycosylase/DNA-(apurinic or apyrimidinic site) lyase, partial [Proteobacteria bacterium]|nr:bifunctional DNA-formamidopyrimidine glycosylase/DNA-(apurinic or apyrimidinic site) lyase [Pseudomonadota bacterium]